MTLQKSALLSEISCAFSRLETEFGFSGPAYERLGHEHYFRYVRGSQTISIMVDLQGPPLIEMFLPVKGTSFNAVPWAELNGVPRYRRFPNVRVSLAWKSSSTAEYLLELMAKFEQEEAEFLRSP